MPTFDANVLPNNTGHDLGSPSQRWDGYFQNLDVSGTTNITIPNPVLPNPLTSDLTGNVTGNVTGDVASSGSSSFKNLNDIRFASQFTGADSATKISAAATDLSGGNGAVFASSSMATGGSQKAVAAGTSLFDFRANNGGGHHPSLAIENFPQATSSNDHWYTLKLWNDAIGGGVNNTGGPKSNYKTLDSYSYSRSAGQNIGINSRTYHFSNGDTIGASFVADSSGRPNAGGDEGMIGVRSEVQWPSYYNANFTGTVSSNTSGVLVFSTTTNGTQGAQDSRGEGRPLIITTPAKVNAVTFSAVSGTPPTVTVGGLDLAATYGTGAKTNLFWAVDGVNGGITSGTKKYVIPIRSITNSTTMVLDFAAQGADQAWPAGLPTTGTGSIYSGGIVTAVSRTSTGLTVSPYADFAATDTVEEVDSYLSLLAGSKTLVVSDWPAYSANIISGLSLGKYSVGQGLLLQGGMTKAIYISATAFSGQTEMSYGIDFGASKWAAGATLLNVGTGQANDSALTLLSNGRKDGSSDNLLYTKATTPTYQFTTNSANAYTFEFNANSGSTGAGAQLFRVSKQGVPIVYVTAGSGVIVNNSNILKFYSGNQASETARIDATDGSYLVTGAAGETWKRGSATELLTLSTTGTTTDTSANLLPANSIIEAVVARVTTTITTATDWRLGDPTTPTRFMSAANSTMTAGATAVGLYHADQTGAAGPVQTSAAKVRVTTTVTPGAGAIRITVYYRQMTAPTS